MCRREIFISYSRRDYDAVREVRDVIEGVSGVKCWMDLNNIETGTEEFSKEIIQGINSCQVFLFMLSPRSQESEYALRELRFARKKGKRTVLVEIDDCLLNDYFDFNFGTTDIVRWSDVLQRDKLIRDLVGWLPPLPGEGGDLPESKLIFNVNGVEFKMVKVDEGSFWMGADSGVRVVKKRGLYRDVEVREVNSNVQNFDSDANDDERPVHNVNLSSYYMGETLVTQALWKAVMGYNPSFWKGDNLPVEKVNWNDCQMFINKLNSMTGKNFRLPTEAEWEFAARGGREGRNDVNEDGKFSNVAWYGNNSGGKTHAVKGKQPNELGLYDMFGNVWEWCGDWYGGYGFIEQTNPRGSSRGSHRVLRGGSWRYNASRCRVTRRSFGNPDYGFNDYGFRLVLPQ